MRWLPAMLVILMACGDDAATDGGIDPADARAVDAFTPDAAGERDSALADGATDAAMSDVSMADAVVDAPAVDAPSPDAARPDASTPDAGDDAGRDAGCTYIDDLFISDCEGGYGRVRRVFSTTEVESCPEYFTVGGARFDTLGEAMVSRGCAEACLRAPRNSFTILRCGRRTGYISFVDDEGCDPATVIETSDGIFASQEEWDAAFPCP